MITLISIIVLLIIRNRCTNYKQQINTIIIILTIWLAIGSIIRSFLQGGSTNVEMSQNKDNPELKIDEDGSVSIILKGKNHNIVFMVQPVSNQFKL